MIRLLKFEWHYHSRGVLLYAALALFFAMGFLVASVGNYSFPGMNRNSPYIIFDVTGLLSLALLFSTALFVAKSFLRESDAGMESMVYATPVLKRSYLSARFFGVFIIGALCMVSVTIGMALGHCMPWLQASAMGSFKPMHYLWALLVIGLPNALFCAAVLASIAWFTRNRLAVYISALFLYILYMVGAALSNSPLLAGASPASAETMSMAAKLDPFGMAAFFEQTRYWTASQRNETVLALDGNFLLNRVLWPCFSIILMVVSITSFEFRKITPKRPKKRKQTHSKIKTEFGLNRQIAPETGTIKHGLLSMFSFVRVDVAVLLNGIAFPVIILILCALVWVELLNAVDGGTRMPEALATSALVVNVLLEVMPTFTMFVLLFYGSELVHRSTLVKFAPIEDATPHSRYSALLSKLVSLFTIVLILVMGGLSVGFVFQFMKGNAAVEPGLYLSMGYYIGLPLFVVSTVILAIQTAFTNRFAGIATAMIFMLLFSSGLGITLGITNPLLRLGDVIKIPYSEMNGFGGYANGFFIKMLYNLGLCTVIFIGCGTLRKKLRHAGDKWLLLLGVVFFIGTGSYIGWHISSNGRDLGNARLEWKIAYETYFRKFKPMPTPTVTDIKTHINLFPDEQRYEVQANYQMINGSGKPIDSLLVYFDKEASPLRIVIPGAKLVRSIPNFGHYWFRFTKPVVVNAHLTMKFSFRSGWSGLIGHTPFNSIIENGSFMRISNYFPRFGYQSSNETENLIERQKRQMGLPTQIPTLEDHPTFSGYDFINLDAIVSTNADQVAIGSGKLLRHWEDHKRNYFHYKTSRPIPFRFALSSARYAIRRVTYHGIPIEVFYHPTHAKNVDSLVTATKKTLDYCEKNFGKYPFDAIRYAEISSFAEGFAATAYPGVIYMKENGGFSGDCSRGNKEDAINQLAGHELSHQWWGQQLVPEEKEGGWLLTETLAQYTELMLYEKAHGRKKALETVRIHLDQYLANRAFSHELPLYKTHYDTPHLPYNKGMVIMHQLRLLIGEDRIDRALRTLIDRYAYPNFPPDSRALVKAFLNEAPFKKKDAINRMFTQIETHSSTVKKVSAHKEIHGNWNISMTATSEAFIENGNGKRTKTAFNGPIDVGFVFADGSMSVNAYPVISGKISTRLKMQSKPVKIILDPYFKTIDTFPDDNEMELN